jgi:hypothetical protein
MPAFYRANGKQILRCDDAVCEHVADCGSAGLASTIASLLNLPAWLDHRADRSKSRWAARLYRIIADDLRARLHEEDKADG